MTYLYLSAYDDLYDSYEDSIETTGGTDIALYDTNLIFPGDKLSDEDWLNNHKEISQLYNDTPKNVLTALHRDNKTLTLNLAINALNRVCYPFKHRIVELRSFFTMYKAIRELDASPNNNN